MRGHNAAEGVQELFDIYCEEISAGVHAKDFQQIRKLLSSHQRIFETLKLWTFHRLFKKIVGLF